MFFLYNLFRPSQSKLDYDNACLVTRYLAANRPFSQSFDIYLTQVRLSYLPDLILCLRVKINKYEHPIVTFK